MQQGAITVPAICGTTDASRRGPLEADPQSVSQVRSARATNCAFLRLPWSLSRGGGAHRVVGEANLSQPYSNASPGGEPTESHSLSRWALSRRCVRSARRSLTLLVFFMSMIGSALMRTSGGGAAIAARTALVHRTGRCRSGNACRLVPRARNWPMEAHVPNPVATSRLDELHGIVGNACCGNRTARG